MTVIKELTSIEGRDVGLAQTGRRKDVLRGEGSNHRAEFENFQAEQIGV